MSTELLGRVIDATEALTQTVEGKINEIDSTLANAVKQLDDRADGLNNNLPRICVTQNPFLDIEASTQLPDGFYIHSDVTLEHVAKIDASPNNRTPEQVALLKELETDLGISLRSESFHHRSFNIVKLTWSKVSEGSSWLAYPNFVGEYSGAVGTQGKLTFGAFIKVLFGEISGYWGSGAVEGKWCFRRGDINPTHPFAHYVHLHPLRKSESGSVLVALPFATTGHVEDAESWYPQVLIKE